MFKGKEVIEKNVEMKKNKYGNVSEVSLQEVYSHEEVPYQSIFHYKINEIAAKATKVADHEIYSRVSINHENPIDYKQFHEKTMKIDFCLRLIGKTLEDFTNDTLSEDEKELLLKVFKNVECISEEKYNEETKKTPN